MHQMSKIPSSVISGSQYARQHFATSKTPSSLLNGLYLHRATSNSSFYNRNIISNQIIDRNRYNRRTIPHFKSNTGKFDHRFSLPLKLHYSEYMEPDLNIPDNIKPAVVKSVVSPTHSVSD